ncbi:MAG: N-acetylmuramoyl-L-alanine amidase-like domain-containing protein [Ignavibacteriaceae bacterium]
MLNNATKILLSLISFVLFASDIQSQIFSEEDIKIFNRKISFADENELSKKPINEIIVEIGKSFIGTEYAAHTLEKDGDENLVINFLGLDCTTFLETSLTLARCIEKGTTKFQDYQNELTFLRYRDGKIDKYPSRLHYFSDWIFNNQQKNIVKDVTKEIGGELIKFNLNFMTENPEYYKQLEENPDFIPVIRKQEKDINSRNYYYIPKAKVESAENKIKTGDLIAITSSVKGLDINHVGIAVKMDDGKIHFLHAPLVGSKVQITPEPLYDYLKKIKKHTGIIVLRALN